MPAKSDTPAAVSLNLDTLEREHKPEPFVFTLGGERFECADPDEIDYHEFIDVGDDDVARQLEIALGAAYTKFAKHRLPVWKLQRLLEAMRDHYQVGEGDASPRS